MTNRVAKYTHGTDQKQPIRDVRNTSVRRPSRSNKASNSNCTLLAQPANASTSKLSSARAQSGIPGSQQSMMAS